MSKARETANITQQGLADAIGVEVRTIGKAKSSDENPEFDTLVRIVRFLHIPSVNTVSPENEREESNGKNEHLLAFRQLRVRTASCDDQEILLLNAMPRWRYMLFGVRKGICICFLLSETDADSFRSIIHYKRPFFVHNDDDTSFCTVGNLVGTSRELYSVLFVCWLEEPESTAQ